MWEERVGTSPPGQMTRGRSPSASDGEMVRLVAVWSSPSDEEPVAASEVRSPDRGEETGWPGGRELHNRRDWYSGETCGGGECG